MKILIDTHVLLWLIESNPKLSERAKDIFLDKQNSLFFSIASLWEIAIKTSLGKLEFDDDWYNTIKQEIDFNGIQFLPIGTEHCIKVANLPYLHKDPFDRIIIAQGIVEEMSLLTNDALIKSYEIPYIW